MGKSKEETKIEKIIRGLLKLPENRRCINCRILGPQYVCTTFWTFVCTNCSGVHREFSHRVKSISMAKFNSEEVIALQAGGNERARQFYFKTWDTQRNYFPDNSDIRSLREFIKQVYVDRCFTGESHPALVPRSQSIDNEEPYERRSGGFCENLPFHQRTLERYGKYSFKEARSSAFERENNYRYGGYRSSSSRFEGSVGRYQVDGSRIAGRSATDMFTTADIKTREKSTDSSLPPVHHVREVLGDNVPRLRVGNQPKPSERRNSYDSAEERRNFYGIADNAQVSNHSKASNRNVNGPTHCQEGHTQKSGDSFKNPHKRSASASSNDNVQLSYQTSADNAEAKPQSGIAGSLVSFANFPPPESCIEQEQEKVASNNSGNSASSQPTAVQETARNVPAKNTLEYLLFELSPPVDTPSKNHSVVSVNEEAKHPPSTQQTQQHSVFPVLDGGTSSSWHEQQQCVDPVLGAASLSTQQPQQHSIVSVLDASTTNTLSTHQYQQHSIVPVPDGSGTPSYTWQPQQHSVASVLGSATPWTLQTQQHSVFPVVDGASSAMQNRHQNEISENQPEALSVLPSVAAPIQENKSAAVILPAATEARSSGRTDLPAELFSSINLLGPLSSWQTSPSHGLGFSMQYHTRPMQIPTFPTMTKSRNPFDTDDNTTQHYAANNMFPSLAPMQGGLSNVSSSADISPSSSFGSNPGFPPTLLSSCPAGAYMGQYLYSNVPPTRQHGISGYGSIQQGSPGPFNQNQVTQYAFPQQTNMNSLPKGGGNPFG